MSLTVIQSEFSKGRMCEKRKGVGVNSGEFGGGLD